MKTITLKNFIEQNELSKPESTIFNFLKENLTYFKNLENSNEISNYNFERGILLYGLMKKLLPKNILEIGTSNGFSTFCMGWGLEQTKTCKLHTIDLIPNDESFKHYYIEKNILKSKTTSRTKLWNEIGQKSWLEKIEFIEGYSSEVFSNKIFPPIDFFYIDGAHFFDGFKYDFLSCILNSNNKSFFLCDDYIAREDYGVKKFIDEYVDPIMDVTLIKTDESEYYLKNRITHSDYGMCFFELDKKNILEQFSEKYILDYQKKYSKFEHRLKIRNRLNKKIPFLKNIRFRKLFSSL